MNSLLIDPECTIFMLGIQIIFFLVTIHVIRIAWIAITRDERQECKMQDAVIDLLTGNKHEATKQ